MLSGITETEERFDPLNLHTTSNPYRYDTNKHSSIDIINSGNSNLFCSH